MSGQGAGSQEGTALEGEAKREISVASRRRRTNPEPKSLAGDDYVGET